MILKTFGATCFLTFKCNYQCPYCQENLEGWMKFKDISSDYWIKTFKKLPSALLHFTGGEPFLYDGFLDILCELPKRHTYYLFTNLSRPIKPFIDKAPLEQLLTVMASIHPSQIQFSLKHFLKKIDYLQSYNIPVIVNLVAYPPQIPLIAELKQSVEDRGAIFNVDPYISKDGSYLLTSEEEMIVRSYLTQHRTINPWEEQGYKKLCSAGVNYVTIISNGDVYPCETGFAHHLFKPIGNIQNNWSLSSNLRLCTSACLAMCDKTIVTIWNQEGEVIWQPPYRSFLLLKVMSQLLHRKSIRHLWNRMPSTMKKLVY